MYGLTEIEDEDCCSYCGVCMEGSHGPPGPRHKDSCPVRIEERLKWEESSRREAAFDAHYGHRKWPCGCVTTARGVEEGCFTSTCTLLKEWERFNG